MPLKTNTLLQLGRYRIIDALGRGGFGITYLAEQVMPRRKVCIKEYFPKDYYRRDSSTGAISLSSEGFAETMNKYKAKFLKEAQTIANLNHANIIHIYDTFEENNTAYYVMEYVEGESLSDLVKQYGALSESRAVGYIRQVALALEHIHQRSIMHLDVKPANVMLRSQDYHAILIDFGVSKHYDSSGEATSTTPVGVSHGYAPIEQYKKGGVNSFSPETDIYSLGATLYYLVTGVIPPEAATLVTEPLDIPERVSSVVRDAITKAMSIAPAQRPHNTQEFIAMLESVVAENEMNEVVEIEEVCEVEDDNDKTAIANATHLGAEAPPDNEIWYTSSNGEIVIPNKNADFGARIVSNTYHNGRGVIKFDGRVTKIERDAFFWLCKKLFNPSTGELRSINIPYSVESIGTSAFYGCDNLSEFRGKFASDDGRCLIVDRTLIAYASACSATSFTVPSGITTINESAFSKCASLESITIPNSVTTIGKDAFWFCSNLRSVYCNAITPPSYGRLAFAKWENDMYYTLSCKIYVPRSSVEKYQNAEGWSVYKDQIVGYDFD